MNLVFENKIKIRLREEVLYVIVNME